MSLTVDQAYTQIKNLEKTGKLTLPEPKGIVDVGSIDVSTGKFTWNVPTFVKTIVFPPRPPGKTNTFVSVTVGLVATRAVDLILKFDVKGAGPLKTQAAAPRAKRTGKTTVFDIPSGITIAGNGFPTVSDTSKEILVDAGLSLSSLLQASNVTPPVSTFPLAIAIPGHPSVNIEIVIVRPPVLGMGAFTLPAVPITIVYAPPQGKQQKNSATYTDMTSFTRSVTTTVGQGKTVKTAQAYTAADYISKISGAIATVAAIIGTGGAGAGAGGVTGAVGALFTALVGNSGAQQSALSASDGLKLASSELSAVSTVLTAVDATTTPDSSAVATQDDHTVKLVLTDMSMFTSTAGKGPGVGDRVVYFKNVRVVWMALNGEVGFHVLGFDRVSADSVESLQADLAATASGGQNNSGLDAATLQSLLNMDPFCVKRRNVVTAISPPLVSPPRFVRASPPERSGVGTGAQGDVFTVIFDQTVEDKHTETATQTKVTDDKPGWVSAMFGGSDTATNTTMTFTNTQVSDVQNEQKVTNSVALFSQDATDPYDVLIFYDKTFGTFLYASKGAAVLQGGTIVGNTGFKSTTA